MLKKYCDLNLNFFQLDPVMYKLYGVLVHAGYSCNSGHYYCYVKGSNGMWYEMNDNRVSSHFILFFSLLKLKSDSREIVHCFSVFNNII